MPDYSEKVVGQIIMVDPNRVRPYAQPRQDHQTGLEGIRDTIAQFRQIEACIVRRVARDPQGRDLELIMGEGRWRAAMELWSGPQRKLLEVRIVEVKDYSEQYVMTLIGDTQRREYHPMDLAKAIGKLAEAGTPSTQIASAIGKSVAEIEDAISVLDLPEEILDRLQSTAKPSVRIPYSLGVMIAARLNPEQQAELAREVVKAPGSAASVSDLITKIAGDGESDGEKTYADEKAEKIRAKVSRATRGVELASKVEPGEMLAAYRGANGKADRLAALRKIDTAKRKLEDLRKTLEAAGPDTTDT